MKVCQVETLTPLRKTLGWCCHTEDLWPAQVHVENLPGWNQDTFRPGFSYGLTGQLPLAAQRAGLSLWGPMPNFWGPFYSFPFSHPVNLHFFLRIFYQLKKLIMLTFSVLNLRSTTYSKKLIAVIVLHTLRAFCSCNVSTKSLNDILSSLEGKG